MQFTQQTLALLAIAAPIVLAAPIDTTLELQGRSFLDTIGEVAEGASSVGKAMGGASDVVNSADGLFKAGNTIFHDVKGAIHHKKPAPAPAAESEVPAPASKRDIEERGFFDTLEEVAEGASSVGKAMGGASDVVNSADGLFKAGSTIFHDVKGAIHHKKPAPAPPAQSSAVPAPADKRDIMGTLGQVADGEGKVSKVVSGASDVVNSADGLFKSGDAMYKDVKGAFGHKKPASKRADDKNAKIEELLKNEHAKEEAALKACPDKLKCIQEVVPGAKADTPETETAYYHAKGQAFGECIKKNEGDVSKCTATQTTKRDESALERRINHKALNGFLGFAKGAMKVAGPLLGAFL